MLEMDSGSSSLERSGEPSVRDLSEIRRTTVSMIVVFSALNKVFLETIQFFLSINAMGHDVSQFFTLPRWLLMRGLWCIDPGRLGQELVPYHLQVQIGW